jgi:hexosaminidase
MDESAILLWPRPKRVEPAAGVWLAPADLRVREAAPGVLAEAGVRSRTDAATGGPESYRLSVRPAGVEIAASDAAGARHARSTLAQLVRLAPQAGDVRRVRGVEIEDVPDFPERGVLLDVSRTKVPTLDTLFSIADRLASFKINRLQLYTEHTFAYAGHESVWRDASPITPDEARALDRYCTSLGIELVPNQQSFGHMHRWLVHEPYRRLSEVPEGLEHAFSTQREPFGLCPLDPGSLALLEDLYDQLLPCFASRRVNVGLDETFDLGLGRSKAACQARGTGRVYLEFLREVHRRVAERGHRMQFWGDIVLRHPELIGELPRDAIALEWGYEQGHPFEEHLRAFAESGLEFHVCPGTSSWQSVAGRTKNAIANLHAAATHGRAAGASGYLVTDWGDRGHLQPLPVSYPGFLLGAGLSWNAGLPEVDRALLADLLDAHAFDDRARVLGRAALELGDAGLESGSPATNGSALFFLLAFARDPLPHPRMPGLSAEGLERARAHVLERRGRLSCAAPADADGRLAVLELTWAADLLAFACSFGTARLSTPPGAPVSAIAPALRARLRDELAPRIEEHRRLWLARNRPGGLAESARWLERVKDALAPE